MAGVNRAALLPAAAALKAFVAESDRDTDTPEDCERVVQTETETEEDMLPRQCALNTETETEEESVMGRLTSYRFSDDCEDLKPFAVQSRRRRLTTLADEEEEEDDDSESDTSDDESSSSSSSDDGAEADAEPAPGQFLRRVSRPIFKEPEVVTKESLLQRPPVSITRSRSAQAAVPRSRSQSVPSHRRRSIRDADGERATFVRWQDQTGRTGRPLRRRRSSAISLTEEGAQALRIAVQKRTNEQCKRVLINSVCERQKLRYPTMNSALGAASPSVAPPARRTQSDMPVSRCRDRTVLGRRQAVGESAVRFQLVLSQTEETMSENLSFRPPARSHSVAPGEVEFLLRM